METREAATRHRLLREAAHQFARLGYDAASLREIAGRAGIRAATVYNDLFVLGPRPSPNAVKEIVGKGFVDLHCTLCGQEVERIVLYNKVSICRDCAEQIVGVFADGEGEDDGN